jgi:ATP-dependent DNA ligase
MIVRPTNTILSRNCLHQLKYDGFRVLLHYDRGRVTLFTRELNNCTNQFPEFQRIQLPVKTCILEGEMIVLRPSDKPGHPPMPCFEHVLSRLNASREGTIKQLMQKYPAHMPVWDVLYVNDCSLVSVPIEERQQWLKKIIVEPTEQLSVAPSYENGEELFELVRNFGLEGIVSKRLGTGYSFGSLGPWFKKKAYLTEIFTVSAIRKQSFGWSLSRGDSYVGMLEFPPPASVRSEFWKWARPLVRSENNTWIYLEHVLKCKVKFQCYTLAGKLRSPSFVELIPPI